jgi:hypothetical protein
MCARCGGPKVRPFNTGSAAMPVCVECDRNPPGKWHRSDKNRGKWFDPPKEKP